MKVRFLFIFAPVFRRVCFLAAVAGLVPNSLQSQTPSSPSWFQFRGNEGRGVAPDANPPIHWSETENIRWRQPVPGNGWSSPVILDGKLYLTCAILNEAKQPTSLQVLCYQAASGNLLWSKDVISLTGTHRKHDKNSHASPTPIASEGKVYAHFGHYGTVCLSDEGKMIWKQTSLSYEPLHGNGSSPILAGDKLIFSADGVRNPALIALDKNSGQLLWKRIRHTSANRKFSFATPSVFTVNGRQEIVSPASGAVIAYAPNDGRELWRVNYGEGYSVVPKPLFAHNHFYIATGFQRPRLLAIRSGGQGNITDSHITWETSRSVPKTPSMIVLKQELYFVSDGGLVSCVHPLTGNLYWQERIRGNVSASPVAAANRLYISTEEGLVHVLKTGQEFKSLAVNNFGERIFASPAIVGDALIFRTEENLYRVEKPEVPR